VAKAPAEKKSTGLAPLFDLGDLRRGMEKGLDHAKKKIAYRKGLNVERRVAPRDGDIDGSFDEHTGERVKDYGGQNVKSFVPRAVAEKYYINKLEYSQLPKARRAQLALMPIDYESNEVLARRERALWAKLKQFSFIEEEIRRQMKERKTALIKGEVALAQETPTSGLRPSAHLMSTVAR
jgi:hypothetical protein